MPEPRPRPEPQARWPAASRHVGRSQVPASLVSVIATAIVVALVALATSRVGPNLLGGKATRDLFQCRAQLAALNKKASPEAKEWEADSDPGWDVLKLREMVKNLKAEAANRMSKEEVSGENSKQLEECKKNKPTSVDEGNQTSWKGYECSATEDDMKRYLNFTPRAACPNDWYFVQRLIFKKNCFALPRRRCLAVTPAHPTEPLKKPDCYFSQAALKDENLRWDLHQCKSFKCLNERKKGDCRECFNLTSEAHRWKSSILGGISMAEVMALKPGTIRTGLDLGGGSGSFAARMALHGVTVVTTAFNVETSGKRAGLPFMEAIAQRGLIAMHWPHKARLPFYDGVLDIIHSMHTIKYFPPVQFEELLYEWNRVLRTGGILWFEMFYAPTDVMPTYVAIIERLGYKKLYWNYTPKQGEAERAGPHVYLNSVLEKVPTPSNENLTLPRAEDMADIL